MAYDKEENAARTPRKKHVSCILSKNKNSGAQVQVQVLFVTYTTIQRLYNQQWNVSQVCSMDSANIVEYNTSMHKIKWIKNKI